MFNLFDNIAVTSDYAYLISCMGKDVLINGNPVRALITNTNLEQNYDDKRISSLTKLSRGEIMDYEGKRFMIISEQSGERYTKFKGIMRLLPHSITFNVDCQFYAVDCYITSANLGVDNGKVLSMPDGTIQVNLSQNSVGFELKIGDRFIKSGQAFKVVGIDKLTKPGIVILTCAKDQINTATDDMVNEIAGGLACTIPEEPTGSLVITGESEVAKSYTEAYTANMGVSWALYADDQISTTTYATIQSKDNGSCVVKGGTKANVYVQLKAVALDDESLISWKRLKIKGLY